MAKKMPATTKETLAMQDARRLIERELRLRRRSRRLKRKR